MGDKGKGDENVEIVKRLYRCFRDRDHATAFTLYAEDIEWDARIVDTPGLDGIYRGHDGVRRFWRIWLEAWQDIEWQEEEIEVLDDGRLRARILNQRNRGRTTGIWLDQPPYEQLWTIEDGLVTHMEYRWAD
jgi:ketosteroid isomerase-like protein